MSDTSTRDSIGVELLVRAGVPRLHAQVMMATDPGCQAIADEIAPIFARLVERIALLPQEIPA